MAALTMEQDPDLKRFIEDRKQRYYENDKAAMFATSLPLSNNGVEDRRSQLRDERHRDYQRYLERFGHRYAKPGDDHIENPFLPPPGAMPKSPGKREVQQQRMDRKYDQKYDQILQETEQPPEYSKQSSENSKQSSAKQAVYYRMDSPERGLPLGNYDSVKEKLSQERHQDYKNYLKKKRQDESERNRVRYSPSRPQEPLQPRSGDIDYSQMKQDLADERKRDYQDYQGKKYIAPSEHPYKQPIDYKQQRLFLAEERRQEYNEHVNKKEKAEREFALKGRVPTPPGGLDIGQYDKERKALGAARKQEYRELLDKQSQEQLLNRVWDRANETSPAYIGYRNTERPLVGSPRGISLYDQGQRQKERERQNPHQKVHTPPGGLLIGGRADRLRDMAEKKRKYRDELLKQQQEHMYVRAQQDNGIPVLDRTREDNSYVTTKPPPGPGAYRQRDEPTRQTPHYWDEGRPVRSPQSYDSQPGHRSEPAEHAPQSQSPRGAPPAQVSPRRTPLALQTGYRPSTPSDPRRGKPLPKFPYGYGHEEMRKKASEERHRDYQEYMKRESERHRARPDELPPPGPSEFPKGHHYSSDEYEKYRKELQQKQQAEYQEFLQKKYDPPTDAVGLPIGQYRYEPKRLAMEAERNREYNELQKSKTDVKLSESSQGLPLGPYRYRDKIRQMENQRNKEYNEYLQKKQYSELLKKRRDTTMGDLGSSPRLTERDDVLPFLRHQREIEYEKTSEEQNRPKNKEDPTYGKSLPLGQFDELRPLFEKQRNRDYREHLKKKQYSELSKKRRDTTMGDLGSSPRLTERDDVVPFLRRQREIEYKKTTEEQNRPKNKEDPTYGKSLPLGQFDELRPLFEKQRNRDYREHLKKLEQKSLPVTPPELSGLPIGQHNYDTINKAMETQRNHEYNEFLAKLEKEKRNSPRDPEYISGLPIGQHQYYAKDKFLEAQRNRDYNEYLGEHKKSDTDKKRPSAQGGGLPIGPYRYYHIQKLQELERNQEYNEFLKKKYKQPDTTRSNLQPTSFYMGDDSVHEDKKQQMKMERNYEYNKMLSERQHQGRPRSVPITSEEWFGLPIGQNQQYEWRAFLAKQRNKEYNQFLQALEHPMRRGETFNQTWNEFLTYQIEKNQQAPNRTWKDSGDNAQGLILGDTKHENQKKLLNDERRREYNEHLAQQNELPQPKRSWPEPEGRGALLLKQGEYESLRTKYMEQRRKEFLGSLERNQQLRAKQAARREGFTPRDAVEETPVVNALGHYEDFEQKLREERKMETEKFIVEQQNQSYHSPYENFMYPTVAHAERPLVDNLGANYEVDRRRLAEERKRDFELYLEKKQMSDPPRFGRNTPPVVGPYSGLFAGLGQYDLDKQRLKKERQSEYSNFLDKTYAEKGRPYGRPTWAKDINDNEQYPARPYSYEHRSNPETKPRDQLPPIEGQGQADRRPPSYEDILAKKRQLEADRRRFDPGFAPKDDRYEPERNGPPRDGDYAPRDGGYGGEGNQGQDRYRY